MEQEKGVLLHGPNCLLDCAACDLGAVYTIQDPEDIPPLAMMMHERLSFWDEWRGKVRATLGLLEQMIRLATAVTLKRNAASPHEGDDARLFGQWRQSRRPLYLMLCVDERRLLMGGGLDKRGFRYKTEAIEKAPVPAMAEWGVSAYYAGNAMLCAYSHSTSGDAVPAA